MRMALALVLLAGLTVACDALRGALPRDDYRDVYYTNRTDVPVSVYERMAARTSPPKPVAPGRTLHSQVLVPTGRDLSQITSATRRFEAMTEKGEVIFCRTITYAELESLGWRVTIDRTLACQ